MSSWLMAMIGWAMMAVVMAVLWRMQKSLGGAGIVDVAWGLGVGVLGVLFSAASGGGDPTRRVVIAALAFTWACRLSGHIFARLRRLPEDGRYQALKAQWGDSAQRKLFVFFQIQALWSMLFALPMLIAARNPDPALGLFDLPGLGIWLAAVAGETAADRQLSAFRTNPANRGKVCEQGLWHYSRHPNYFFEWLHWWTYALFAVGAPWGWLAVLAPLLMLYFLLNVTGIPPTEAQALKSRGEAYREYQRMTSAFFPWPPKQPRAPDQAATP